MRLGSFTGGVDRPGLNAVNRVAAACTLRTDAGLSSRRADGPRDSPADCRRERPPGRAFRTGSPPYFG